MKGYNLREFQKDFMATLDKSKSSETLLQGIIPAIKMKSKDKSLTVYKDGYKARLTEALGETYEACWWALGDEMFFGICSEFISAHPSLHYNLSEYGREFSEYLYHHKISQKIPFLFDLAHFEWAFKNMFHAKNHIPFSAEELSKLESPNDLKVSFGKSVFLFQSKYSIYHLWQQAKDKLSDKQLDFNKKDFLILYKKNSHIFVDRLCEKEFSLLRNLKLGYSLGEALGFFETSLLQQEVSNFFQKMMKREIIESLKVS